MTQDPVGLPAATPLPPPVGWPPAPPPVAGYVGVSPPRPGLPSEGPPADGPYPMRFEVEYPERLNRLSTFFRIVLVVPALLFLYLVWAIVSAAFVGGWFAVFLRRKYPSWLFAGGAGALGFLARTGTYGLLLTDCYPAFEPSESPVVLEYERPPSGRLSRWRVFFWKAALILPHLFVLYCLQLAVAAVTVMAWFAILFTGNYPRGLFGFTTGVMRWHFRVAGYFASYNDRFPPFAFSSDAGPASKATTVICGSVGGLAAGGLLALGIIGAIVAQRATDIDASYAALQRGVPASPAYTEDFDGDRIWVGLVRVYDPAGNAAGDVRAGSGERVIVFEWIIRNEQADSVSVAADDASLELDDGQDFDPRRATLDGRSLPGKIESDDEGTVRAIFVIPAGSNVRTLRFQPDFWSGGGIAYHFREE